MNNLRVKIALTVIFCGYLISNSHCQSRIYLSGKDAATARDWEFKVSAGRSSGFWTTIPVPSNWETEGFGYYLYGMDKLESRDIPVGFYRHSFDFDPGENKRYFLVFQGSMTDTHVTLNGVKVGFHQGGFTEFKFEITDMLINGENTLEVEVNSSSANESVVAAERFADYWMFSGIFRPVFIEETSIEYIDHVAINAEMTGDLTMWVYTNGIVNASSISAQLYDQNQQKIGKPFRASIEGEKTTLKSVFPNVKLWSHEFPNLYTVEVQLRNRKEVLHSYKQKFGFRTFEVRDHDGFYLNGKRILLKGASVHSFMPETGRTLTKAHMLENVRLMQNLNFNCARASHYPADTYFLDMCDSLGLLVMAETTGWYRPLETEIGSKLVNELVVRDVNHPSIVLWSNGNHMAHNPALDKVFFEWDIQKRRPLKNEAKNNDIFANYNPDFDIVNTTYYPNYETTKKRLFDEDHIYLPNETLHALYDGGGGANLKTYWDMFEQSKVGGGLMIWALYDEGLIRTDMGFTVDNQHNKAADGIVGPHGEKEGSYYAVREIWSPVVISNEHIGNDFDGTLNVQNKFTFTDLDDCEINWKLINFPSPDATYSGHRTINSGAVRGNVMAGETGKLILSLPASYINSDALIIEVYDARGIMVYDKRIPITTSSRPTFRPSEQLEFAQSNQDKFTFHRGGITLSFDEGSGILSSVLQKGKATSLKNFPFLTFEAVDTNLSNVDTVASRATIRKEGSTWIIETRDSKGFDYLQWTLKPTGEIKLDYAYTLNEGMYHYSGIGMEVSANDVNRKRWLGEGPARIWNNRIEGGTLDVYNIVLNRTKQLQPTRRLVSTMMAIMYLSVFHFTNFVAIILINLFSPSTLSVNLKLNLHWREMHLAVMR